jgi:hypothetical protein
VLKISYLCAIRKTARKFLHNNRATNAVLALNLCCNQGRPNARKNTLTRMDRIVTFVVFDNEYQVTVKDCDSDRLAKDAVFEQLIKSFHIRAITPVKPKKRTSLWATYADGFKMFFQRLSPIC